MTTSPLPHTTWRFNASTTTVTLESDRTADGQRCLVVSDGGDRSVQIVVDSATPEARTALRRLAMLADQLCAGV